MIEQKEKLELNGWDYVDGKFTDQGTVSCQYQNFGDAVPGNVITHAAAQQMVDTLFWKEESKKLEMAATNEERELIMNQTAAITFSKRLLLLILSQKNCEGIRFYICRRPDPVGSNDLIRSLVMVGTDKSFKDLGTSHPSGSIVRESTSLAVVDGTQKTIIAEVGGHDTLESLNQKLNFMNVDN